MKTRHLLFLIVMMLNSSFASKAQTDKQNSVFISANLGRCASDHDGFSKTYNKQGGLAFGGGLGLRLSDRFYLYSKITYFHKNGVTWWTFSDNQTRIDYTGGNAEFTQWIFNGGIQYGIIQSEKYNFFATGGAAATTVSNDQYSSILMKDSIIDVTTLGFFAGIGLERKFNQFSVTAEIQFNFAPRTDYGKYNITNLSLGVRYYFKRDKKS